MSQKIVLLVLTAVIIKSNINPSCEQKIMGKNVRNGKATLEGLRVTPVQCRPLRRRGDAGRT
jgi:hypothetical protein